MHLSQIQTEKRLKELQQQIEERFTQKYQHDDATLLATSILDYFVLHQFDEWKDIVDDICNGYDDCCCKLILFKILKLNDITQKTNEYLKLKQCIDHNCCNKLPFDQIHKDIITVFSTKFNHQTANIILNLFIHIVNEEQFEDEEAIRDDVEYIDSSAIISYIEENIDYNQFNDKKKMVQPIISNGIKCICQNKTNILMKQDNKPIIIPRNQTKAFGFPISSIPRSIAEDPNIEEIRHKIMNEFSSKYDEHIATKILKLFNEKYIEEKFAFENLQDDVDDIENSDILSGIDDMKEISNDSQYDIIFIKTKIQQIIQVQGKKIKFDITKFDLNVDEKDIENGNNLVNIYCNTIYEHAFIKNIDLENKSLNNSEALCICKGIDIRNNKPILKWLLKSYSIDRYKKHKNNAVDRYTHDQWWFDNKYCKFINRYYPKMAQHIKSGIAELSKRALTPLNYNARLSQKIIDSMNDLAKYALTFHYVADQIKQLMIGSGFEWAPLQIDYIIIPQGTKPNSNDDIGFDIQELDDEEIMTSFKQNDDNLNKINNCGQEQNEESLIWDIKHCLEDLKIGFIEGLDYFMEETITGFEDTKSLIRQIFGMLKKYQNKLSVSKQRCNRFIFIIDRRNPDNIKQKNMQYVAPIIIDTESKKNWSDRIYFIAPKQYRNNDNHPLCICGLKLIKTQNKKNNISCSWCKNHININIKQIWQCPKGEDNEKHKKGYFLCGDSCEKMRPEMYGKLPSKWQLVPESGLGLSKKYILYNPKRELPAPIGMLDALHGYKFGFSYHILSEDNISVYWYFNQGAQIFELDQMKWLWNRFFIKYNNKPQQLNENILREIKQFKKDKQLIDIDFQEFTRQCNNIIDDIDH